MSRARHKNTDSLAVLGENSTLWGGHIPTEDTQNLCFTRMGVEICRTCATLKSLLVVLEDAKLAAHVIVTVFVVSVGFVLAIRVLRGFYPYVGRFVGFAWEVLPSRREETKFRPSSTTEHVLCHGLLTGKGSVNYLAVAGQCFPQCKTSPLYRFAGALTKLCKTHEQTSSGLLATGSAFRVKSNIFVSTGLTLCLEDGLYGCGCTNTIGTLFT